jgi:hypothetical protein
MDYSLIALIGVIAVAVVLSMKLNGREWSRRAGSEYRRVFTLAAVGLLFTVSGAIGWDLSSSHGWFQGARWVAAPVWWQLGLGVACLGLSVFFARRVRPRPAARS